MERLQFNISLRYFRRLARPKKQAAFSAQGLYLGEEEIMEDEQEIDEYYFNVGKLPINEEILETAMQQIKARVRQKLTQVGCM